MAVAALAIAGCSQNEVMEVSPDANPAVGFDVYTGAQTRIDDYVVADNTTIRTDGFGVLAYFTGTADWAGSTETPNFMYTQGVTYGGGNWSYTPVKYWPKNTTDKITFFAYAPYDPTEGTRTGVYLSPKTAQGNPTVKSYYDVDLVIDESQKDKTSASGTIAFKFKHIMSRVNLVAKAQTTLATGTSIVIKGVKVVGNSTHSGSKFYNTAVYTTNLATGDGAWAASTDVAPTRDIMILDKKPTGITGYDKEGIKIDASNTTTEVPLFQSGKYKFFIPVENFQKGDIKLKITYDIVTNDTSDATKAVASEATETVDLPAGILKKGTAYKLTFAIGLNPIVVSGEIDTNADWPAAGGETAGDLTN